MKRHSNRLPVALAAFSGDLQLDPGYGDARRSDRDRRDRRQLKLTLGDGELDVVVRTHSGDINLYEL